MARINYTDLLLDRWFTIALFAIFGLALALVISFVQPLKYSSTVRLLILQDVDANVDAFTASRSEERIAENLSRVIYTTTFFDQVLNAGFSVDGKQFPEEDSKRRREWGKTVSATVTRGTGLLTISAFHQDVHQAEQIARAIGFVLTERAGEYTSGSNIRVRLIDAPLNSRWPVRPNILANGVSGLILGGFVGIAYILLSAERIRRRHQLIHR
jgi:capsular polysaccharide biosynthesis protein